MKYYTLKRHCCTEMNIVLCLQHLEARIRDGWRLMRDNGPDNGICYDCRANIKVS